MYLEDDADDSLQTELAIYYDRLKGFHKHEGEYVVIRGKEILGFYPDYNSALEAGYEKYKLDPFMAKRVSLNEESGFLPVCRYSHASSSFETDPS